MLKRFAKDVKKYFAYTKRATKANLKAEVANSYLNWIWWVLEPICFTLIYYLVFGLFFGSKEPYFLAFIGLGVCVWNFYSSTIKNSVRLMKNNKSIVSKVYIPKQILILIRIGVNGFKAIISFVIAIVIMIIMQVPLSWKVILAVPVMLLLVLFTFGVSCYLMHFGVYVADLYTVVDIVLKLTFYLTGVFYNITRRIKGTAGVIIANVNPVAFIMTSLRNVMLYDTIPNLYVFAGWFAVAIILCITGIIVVYKNENSYVKSI